MIACVGYMLRRIILMYYVLMIATNYIPIVTMLRLIYHISHHMNYDLH